MTLAQSASLVGAAQCNYFYFDVFYKFYRVPTSTLLIPLLIRFLDVQQIL